MSSPVLHPGAMSARDDRPSPGVSSLDDVSQEKLANAIAPKPNEPVSRHVKKVIGAEPGTDEYKQKAMAIPTKDQLKRDHDMKAKEHALAARDHQIMHDVEKVQVDGSAFDAFLNY